MLTPPISMAPTQRKRWRKSSNFTFFSTKIPSFFASPLCQSPYPSFSHLNPFHLAADVAHILLCRPLPSDKLEELPNPLSPPKPGSLFGMLYYTFCFSDLLVVLLKGCLRNHTLIPWGCPIVFKLDRYKRIFWTGSIVRIGVLRSPVPEFKAIEERAQSEDPRKRVSGGFSVSALMVPLFRRQDEKSLVQAKGTDSYDFLLRMEIAAWFLSSVTIHGDW